MVRPADLEARFRRAMTKAGVPTEDRIVADGELHRVHVEGDRHYRRNGWYVLHPDEPPAGAFGCWKRGVSERWCAEAHDDLSSEARKRWQQKIQERRRERARERRERRERARRKASRMLEEAEPAEPEHPYLRRKGIQPRGPVRQLRDTLLIPLYGGDGELRGLQRIRPDGTKRFLAGTEVSGSYLPLGGAPDGTLAVAEGYSTAVTVHEATGEPVAVAFNAGNLAPVAEALREKLGPDVDLVLAADNDTDTKGNPGLTAALEAAEAVGGQVAIPEFQDGEEGSDFNDLVALRGPAAVRAAFERASTPNGREQGEDGGELDQDGAEGGPLPFVTTAANVEAEEVGWLWGERLPRGKLCELFGDPGGGKTTLALAITTGLTLGESLPGDTGARDPTDVLFVSAEDGQKDTLRPRLDDLGADLDRVHFVEDARGEEGGPEAFRLDRAHHLQQLDRAIRQYRAGLVVFDPISAYLGNVNPHRDADVRRVLKPLAALAARTGVTVLWIRHLRKSPAARAMYRAGGSIAFIAAARSAFLVGSNPENSMDRALVHVKSNLGPLTDPVGFTLEGGRFEWNKSTDLTAAKILAGEEDADTASKREEAKRYLRLTLAEGRRPAEEMKEEAETLGISDRTLRRAREELRVEWQREGFGKDGTVYWSLPEGKDQEDENGQGGGPDPKVAKYGNENAQNPGGSSPLPLLATEPEGGQVWDDPGGSGENRRSNDHTCPRADRDQDGASGTKPNRCAKCGASIGPTVELCAECKYGEDLDQALGGTA